MATVAMEASSGRPSALRSLTDDVLQETATTLSGLITEASWETAV
ncbi:MAG: hypothetical protein ACYS26_13590 [Planctomycetota bacterium]